MSSSANAITLDDEKPQEGEEEDAAAVGVGEHQEKVAENRSKSSASGGGVIGRQDENGRVVHDDNSKDFVVRDGFPALRLPRTDTKNGSSTTSCSSAVDQDSSTTTTNINNKNKKNVWWIDGDEPIPRASFWAHDECFQFNAQQLPTLLRDAKHVFSARTREAGQAYSAGTTYFVPSIMKPRCALEAMALQIFQRHTQHLADGVVIPEQSGAEWWTLVLNENDENDNANDNAHKHGTAEATSSKNNNNNNNKSVVEEEESVDDDDDEVGLHFDADYGLEDQVPNLLLHPRLATVTYLTGAGGAPTVVFDCPSPHSQRRRRPEQQNPAAAKAKNSNNNENDDDDAIMLSWHGTNVRRAWISHPKVGKHIAFDGRLLHGAPATFFPPTSASIHEKKIIKNGAPPRASNEEEVEAPAAKKAKLSLNDQEFQEENQLHENPRITFLVNIWINHCPLDAEPLDDEICEQLETPWDWWSPPSSSSSTEQKSQLDTIAANTTEGETKKTVEAATSTTKTAPPIFTWNDNVHFDKPPVLESVQVQKWSSIRDADDRQELLLEPAGEEEVVICNRLVTVKYESTMDDLHQATNMAGLVELNFDDGALVIQVGEKVESEEDDEDDGDECGNDNEKRCLSKTSGRSTIVST
jgi:hypothetical protein